MHEYPYRTCAEIDLNKLQRNLQRLRALIGPSCQIMEVMKADAYGHGLRVCAEYAAPYVDWFAAATLEEALAVRAADVKGCDLPQFSLDELRIAMAHVPGAAERLADDVFAVLTVEGSLASRKHIGGTAPEQVRAAVARARARLA